MFALALALILALAAGPALAANEVCDFQGTCYPAAPAAPTKAPADPNHFDTRSTARTDCDATGCPPMPRATAPAAPASPPEALAPEYAPPPPEAAQSAECARMRQGVFLSVRALIAAHRLCDGGRQ
jgi:hypothetical protein